MKLILSMCCVVLLAIIGAGDRVIGVVFAEEPVTCKVAPTAKTPEDKVGDTSPTFTWQALSGCTNYQLYLANDESILSITWVKAEDAGCAGGSGNCTHKPERVLVEGDYGWWVRGWQPREGTSKWSAGTRFTIDVDICAKRPLPVTPLDDTLSNSPVYSWQSVYGCQWYQLSASGPDGNVLNQWVNVDDIGCESEAVCSFEPGYALPPGTYFWWIRGWSRGTQIGRWTIPTSFFIVD